MTSFTWDDIKFLVGGIMVGAEAGTACGVRHLFVEGPNALDEGALAQISVALQSGCPLLEKFEFGGPITRVGMLCLVELMRVARNNCKLHTLMLESEGPVESGALDVLRQAQDEGLCPSLRIVIIRAEGTSVYN